MKLRSETKEYNYYSRINAIGIYKVVCEIEDRKASKEEEDINVEIKKFTEILDYEYSRVEKDISLYKSNAEKMRQALEIISLNISSK